MNIAAPASANESVRFLKFLRRRGPWLLIAIHPDKGLRECAAVSSEPEVLEFICKHNSESNVYYSLNPTRSAMSKKPAKSDIAAIEYLHTDLDPREDEAPEAAKARYLTNLDNFTPRPGVIVDSGNGIQALWPLSEPVDLTGEDRIERISDIEERNAAITRALGCSDVSTKNVDRILRLPGTTNHPNAVKRKKGRGVCRARLLATEGGACALDDFPQPQPQPQANPKARAPAVPDSRAEERVAFAVERLPISERIRSMIKSGSDPDASERGRSECVLAVAIALAAIGCTDEQFRAIFLDPKYLISAHVLDQPKRDEYLGKQIAKARELAVDPDVAEINEKYAFVIVGDKPAILMTEGKEIKFWTLSAFKTYFANRHVQLGKKRIKLADHWIEHPQRRTYRDVVFDPEHERLSCYNLFQGWAIGPREGDCSKFLTHIRDNICGGDEDIFRWIVGWFADIFQNPAKKKGTALVLRGAQGVGKSKVGDVIGYLQGAHYVSVGEPRYITGRFNSHLASCLMLRADEGFWAGDRAAEGKLKDLVTGEHHLIEYKGREPFRIKNHTRLLVSGNNDWQVPAGFGERRFAVIDVGEQHKDDHAYFAAIDEEMRKGGYEALLDYLLKFDLSTVNLRQIPKTSALLEQKVKSMTPEQAWWFEVLNDGALPGNPKGCRTKALYDSYLGHAKLQGVNRRSIETQVGFFLRKIAGARPRQEEGQVLDGGRRTRWRVYDFPALADCRKAYEESLGQKVDWDGGGKWRLAPPPDGGI